MKSQENRVKKPKYVGYAGVALWGSWGILAFSGVLDVLNKTMTLDTFVACMFGICLLAALTYKIMQGKNWARLVFAVWESYCQTRSALEPVRVLEGHILDNVVNWILTPVFLLVLYWLFHDDSARWFGKMPSRRRIR
jgi:hypothetical protein